MVTLYLWQAHNEVVGVSLSGCSRNVFHGDLWPAQADVLSNGGSEQSGLLLHHADQRAKPLDVQPTDVMAVQSHLTSHQSYVGLMFFYHESNFIQTVLLCKISK